ncbi:MAG: hypothetical protein ABIS67_15390 [Candidatus Eisenbacteria bacterium]
MKRTARSRRDFMRLLAAGSAAALAAPVAALAAKSAKPAAAPAAKTRGGASDASGETARQRRSRTDQPARRPALPEEIEKQKKYLADSLKRIRDYSLPPGSTPSFVFRPLATERAKRVER